jgi:hypothetical protein
MDKEALIEKYPRLFHMAEKDTWQKIRAHGLLSTSALLDLYEYEGEERAALESALRPRSVTITHERYGETVVRDQRPMSERALKRCLKDGLTVSEWCRLLNRRVFFWVTEERLLRLLHARYNAAHKHDVLVLDTRRVVDDCASEATLSPINSGCTRRAAFPRGRNTFLPIDGYPWERWLKKRGHHGETVVEFAVNGGVYDIEKYVVEVRTMKCSERFARIVA